MRVLLWSAAGFLAGLVAGYGLVLAGWQVYAVMAQIDDHDGAGLVRTALFAAPLGGLAGGIVGAFGLALWAALRGERTTRITSRRAQAAPRSGRANS
jgi:hypothetical protein